MNDAGVPHLGGPIQSPGSLTVLIEDRPAAITCGLCTCQSPTPDVLIMGSGTVQIEGEMAVRMGDDTFHGGKVMAGSGTVEIGVPGDGVISERAVAIGRALSRKAGKGKKKSTKDPAAASPGVGQEVPPPKQDDKDPSRIVCKILDVHASCEHDGRRTGTQRILEVVPTSVSQPDTIRLVALMEDGCEKHPNWSIDGVEAGKGESISMEAWPPIVGSLFPIAATPRKYLVACSSCHSEGGRLEILSYPFTSQSIGYQRERVLKQKYADLVRRNARKLQEFLRKNPLLLELLRVFGDDDRYRKGKKILVEAAKPTVAFSGGWKEIDKDYRAFFEYELKLAADPLLQVQITPLSIGPLKAAKLVKRLARYIHRMRVPGLEWVAEWVESLGEKLNQYVKAEASLQLVLKSSIDLSFKRQAPETALYVPLAAPGATGMFSIGGGYEIKIRNKGKDYVTITGSLDIKASMKSSFSIDAIGIKSEMEWKLGGVATSPLTLKVESLGIDLNAGDFPILDSMVDLHPDTGYLLKWEDLAGDAPDASEADLEDLSIDLSEEEVGA